MTGDHYGYRMIIVTTMPAPKDISCSLLCHSVTAPAAVGDPKQHQQVAVNLPLG